MIYVEGTRISVKGELLTEIGPELVTLVGAIYDVAAPKIGGGQRQTL